MNTLIVQSAFCGGLFRRWFLGSAIVVLLGVSVPLHATSVIPPGFPELVRQADFVVRAVVKSVRSEWQEKNGQRHIYTLVELEVREVVTGTPPQPLVLQMLGGRVGDEELVIQGAPKFQVGEEGIYFVHGNGRQFYPLVALMHGSYPIKREAATGREFMARSNGAPLTSEQEVSRPMAEGSAPIVRAPGATAPSPGPALSPAEFISRIRAQHDKNDTRPQLEK